MSLNPLDILLNELRRALSNAKDPAEYFIIMILLGGLTYELSRKSITNVDTSKALEEEVKWLIEEAKNCKDEKCIETVVRNTVKKLRMGYH